MKFLSATVLIASLTASASAFSAVAPKSPAAKSSSVDKTLHGVDADPNVFDPTSGDNPAVSRNNKDEVWVPQVCNATQRRPCLVIGDLHCTANALLLHCYLSLTLTATSASS
jgi:hypothetical protein